MKLCIIVFCDWLLSYRNNTFNIHRVVACINIFMDKNAFHCMNMLQFVYLFISGWAFIVISVFLIIMNDNISAVNIHVQGFFFETSVFQFFWMNIKKRISKLDGNSVLILRNYQTALPK